MTWVPRNRDLWLRQCVRERDGVRHWETRAYDERGGRLRHFEPTEADALAWLDGMLALDWQKTPREGGRR
jgi:hypothetical protein